MADSARSIVVRNPATGEVLGEVPSFTAEEARAAIDRARRAQRRWAKAPLGERAAVVHRFADRLLDRADDVSRKLTRENGKVLQESFQMEVFPVVDLARYFADHAARILEERRIPLHLLKHRKSSIHYKARGVALVIAPWNYPLSIPMGEVVMALLAGNAAILKPASLTPLIARTARELFDEAGLDADLFQVVTGPGSLGSEMIGMGVDHVSFTGSVETGRRVAELCGRHLVPYALELGGKDPAIVLPDADLDHAAASIVWGGYANAGQTCSSVERVYAHTAIWDGLVERIVERAKELRVGDPLADGTDMGPMTDPNQLLVVERHVGDARAGGARVLAGGTRADRPGQFYLPTVLVDVADRMDVVRHETFGPVLPLMRCETVDEAIDRANDSTYGLNAYVFSSDVAAARDVADRLEAGTVMINETLITHAAPETPWSGVKSSGVGFVHSDDGLRQLGVAAHVNEPVGVAQLKSPFWQPYSHKAYRALLAAARTLRHSQLNARMAGLSRFIREVCPACDRVMGPEEEGKERAVERTSGRADVGTGAVEGERTCGEPCEPQAERPAA
ncbi:MAG: aldehyde dehydrogenase family protein [Deltaproteobacteria bacterium]|nr:aldehyde dehydrogenase family protein [Deltaproteobacteria bacterium]